MSPLPMAYLLGIVLGCLVAVAFGAGFIKLYINKRRLKVNQKKADLEAEAKATDREKLVGKRKLREGDLFGVRALEHGYFGGVAQTRPSSPATSYKLAPEAKLVDWSQMNKPRSDSSSAASSNFDFFADKDSSTSSLPVAGSTVRKPSPLRLQPDAELKHNMSSVGNMGGNFLPPPPSPRSIRAPSPFIGEEKNSNWVSPLDVHFSRPSTPVRPTSFLPKLQFPLEFGKSDDMTIPLPHFNKPVAQAPHTFDAVIVKPPQAAQPERAKTPKEIYAEFSQQGFAQSPTLSNFSQQSFAKSPTSSTFSKQEPSMKSPTFSTFFTEEAPKAKSPTFSVFPQQAQQAPPRPSRLSIKSMFTTEEPAARPSKDDFSSTFQLPPVPLDDLAPIIPRVNPDRFPKDLKVWNPSSPVRDSILNRQRQPTSPTRPSREREWIIPSDDEEMIDAEWQPSEKAIIRASVVSKQRVSVIRRPGAHESQDLDVQYGKMRGRGHSMAASSMYSTRTSILEPEHPFQPRHVRTRSQSSEARRSSSRHRRTSSRSLSRTRDSLRESRKTSSESFRSVNSNRRSRDRDQLHFDPTSQQRNRSGSIQGHSVDFDQPRDSPFSNSNKASHSATSSVSSTSSFERNISPPRPILSNNYQANSGAPLQPRIPFQDPDRLSIAQPQIHGRSGSEASQNSIGDFYDSYYRQSTLNPNNNGIGNRTSVQDRAQMFEDRNRGPVNRPAPLKIGTGYGGFNTIVEVATPMPSPLNVGAGLGERERERFPGMI